MKEFYLHKQNIFSFENIQRKISLFQKVFLKVRLKCSVYFIRLNVLNNNL